MSGCLVLGCPWTHRATVYNKRLVLCPRGREPPRPLMGGVMDLCIKELTGCQAPSSIWVRGVRANMTPGSQAGAPAGRNQPLSGLEETDTLTV